MAVYIDMNINVALTEQASKQAKKTKGKERVEFRLLYGAFSTFFFVGNQNIL